jgi:hypothetical protein
MSINISMNVDLSRRERRQGLGDRLLTGLLSQNVSAGVPASAELVLQPATPYRPRMPRAALVALMAAALYADDDGVGLTDDLGFVNWWSADDYTVDSVDTVAHLAPMVCGPLQDFATTAAKQTECRPLTTGTTAKRVRNGKKWVVRHVSATVHGPLQPCYATNGELNSFDSSYWETYEDIAQAVLTLTHESIHLGGVVGGIVDGQPVGDQQAEAKAECDGMQWLPWAAEQLGAAPADAQAMARYALDIDYPKYQGTAYWSADCRPGGALDGRTDQSRPWP